MDTPSFNKLAYGNIISEVGGQKFVVLHTIKDAGKNTVAIGVAPAFDLTDAGGLTLLNASFSRTAIVGAPGGQIILMGQTVPAPE